MRDVTVIITIKLNISTSHPLYEIPYKQNCVYHKDYPSCLGFLQKSNHYVVLWWIIQSQS